MGKTVIGNEAAMKAIMDGDNVFVTGPGGCGKSLMIASLREFFADSFLFVAPTGIAALNISGITAHKAFGLTFGVTTKEDYKAKSKKPAMLMASDALDAIVFDEISMIRSDKLREIDMKLRYHRKVNKPFGGLQVIMFGDGFQIKPVLKREETAMFRELHGNEIPFGCDIWNQLEFTNAYLPRVHRQSDPVFAQHLNNIRVGNNVGAAVDYFNQNCFGPALPGAVTLTTTNKLAEEINQREFEKIKAQPHVFEAKISGEFPERPVNEVLNLKEGLKVMIVVNDNDKQKKAPDYVNGTVGVIKKIAKTFVIVDIDGKPIHIGKYEWTNVTQVPEEKMVQVEKEIELEDGTKQTVKVMEKQTVLVDKEIGKYLQFPFKLGYAITGHKCVSKNSLVTTPEGYKKIEDVRKGDLVDTGIRGFQKVKTVLETGVKKAILLKTRSGRQLIASPEHLIWSSGKKKIPTFDALGDLKVGQYVGSSLRGYSQGVLEEDAWMLGALIGDGCYGESYRQDHRVDITTQDGEIANEFFEWAWKNGLSVGVTKRKSKALTYYVHGKNVRLDLLNRGLDYVTAHHKRLPKDVLLWDEKCRWEIIAGLFDTDGCFSSGKSRQKIRYTSASCGLLEDLQKVMWSLGLYARVSGKDLIVLGEESIRKFAENCKIRVGYKRKLLKKMVNYTQKKSNWDILPFFDALGNRKGFTKTPTRSIVLHNGGFEGEDGISRDYFWDQIVSIEPSEDIVMYDLEMEGGNTFTCDGLIVHNCQGLTLDKVNIDLGFGTFAPGQAYVMLSRATSTEGLRLMKRLRVKDIIVDQGVRKFYHETFPEIFGGEV
ncbi:helicase [Pectobacterium phage phiTE]|uniref:DOD-type homing endonuclease domain-containing protein n=1 Tax=Pectobacterium phage phiTE TaxID=1116482 RepID=K9L4T9_9CAUD|nr:LAGLIDADG family homing endonuclease [Pectobacterium atrosepticum]YP_007392492.1 helicase [Pectobacterium phage phiTE]AEZ66196.1 hypothetical protein phiTE_030 [Pectobacterium phage phiTE]